MTLELIKQPGPESSTDGNDQEGKAQARKPKPQGSFWITEAALDMLIKKNATASQVCAYLLLSKHTDEDGYFSTAGVQALKDYIGLGDALAKSTIDALVKMDMVCYPGGWGHGKNTGDDLPAIPDRPTGRSQVRYVLKGNYFESGKV